MIKRKFKLKEKVIIYDMEANAISNEESLTRIFDKEIIEIGAVKLHNGVVVDELNLFIKPIINPTLTDFIKELTPITQDQIDDAPIFREVYDDIKEFFSGHHLISCGKWDRDQLLHEIRMNAINDPEFTNHISTNYEDIKDTFRKATRMKYRTGLAGMLNLLNIEPTGIEHSGMDDARNTVEVYKAITQW